MREMGYLSNQPRRVTHRALPSDDIYKLEGIRVDICKLEEEGIRVDICKLRGFNERIGNGQPSLQNAFRATILSANW